MYTVGWEKNREEDRLGGWWWCACDMPQNGSACGQRPRDCLVRAPEKSLKTAGREMKEGMKCKK